MHNNNKNKQKNEYNQEYSIILLKLNKKLETKRKAAIEVKIGHTLGKTTWNKCDFLPNTLFNLYFALGF